MWLGLQAQRAKIQRVVVGEIKRLGGSVSFQYVGGVNPKRRSLVNGLRKKIGNEFFRDVVSVHLTTTPCVDATLEVICRAPGIESLELDGRLITDAGMAYLGRLPKLSRLTVWNASISDAGVRSLCQSSSLQSLMVDSRQLTDKCTDALSQVKSLRYVRFINTSQISTDAIKQMRHALPQTDIPFALFTPQTVDAAPSWDLLGDMEHGSRWVGGIEFSAIGAAANQTGASTQAPLGENPAPLPD
jgi:hypothetical protein